MRGGLLELGKRVLLDRCKVLTTPPALAPFPWLS